MNILETDRLILRQFTATDAPFIIELVNSPGWLKYIGDRNIHTEAEARNYIENKVLPGFTKYGFSLNHVELKSTGVSIGNCGVFQREGMEFPELGYAFLPEYEGKGYAYEAAKACLEYGRNVFSLLRIDAITTTDHHRSIHLLEKLGMRFVKKFFMEGDPDLPIVTGCVFNPDQMPMYKLPDEKTKTYFRSNSSPTTHDLLPTF